MQKRLNIVASGRVQGVFFRASAKRVADGHGLTGYAKNLPDGRVEIIAEGSESGLRALLDWCYRGSLLSNVDGLAFNWSEIRDEDVKFRDFDISRDGNNLIIDQVHALTNLGRRVLNKVDKKVEQAVINAPVSVPKHIVIIPDGNRHWAREHGLPFWKGYEEGFERTKELVKAGGEAGVNHMTFWGFSTENWSRPADEVAWLMKKLAGAVKEMSKELIKNKISFRHLGRKDRLAPELIKSIAELESATTEFKDKTYALALDYGGRDEIIRAFDKARKVTNSEEQTSEQIISESLDTAGLPDPDLIIRTSGEQRLSGILPWQGTYAELYFTPLYFPDFTPAQFKLALADYNQRSRRFGG